MASQSCAWERVKESAVLALSLVGKFPADREKVKILVGRMTRDYEASNMDLVVLSWLMKFAVIAVAVIDCSKQFRLSHRNACALTAM
jgi:predicted oxidoreductase